MMGVLGGGVGENGRVETSLLATLGLKKREKLGFWTIVRENKTECKYISYCYTLPRELAYGQPLE